jgi:hypothetical protein
MTPDEDNHEKEWQTLNEEETKFFDENKFLAVEELAEKRVAVVELFVPKELAMKIVTNGPVMVAFNLLADAEMDLKDAEKKVRDNAKKDEKDREEVNILPVLNKVKEARTRVKARIEKAMEAMSRERPCDEAGPAKKVRTSAQGEAGPAKEDSPPAGGSNAFGAGCDFVDLTKDSD